MVNEMSIKAAVLAPAFGLEMLDALTAPDAVENVDLLVQAFGWNEYRDRLADDLGFGVPKQSLRSLVPARDHGH